MARREHAKLPHQNETPLWEEVWSENTPDAVNILDRWSLGQDERTAKTATRTPKFLTGAMKNNTVTRPAKRQIKTLLTGPEF